MGTMAWHPKWWREESHGSAWLRAKEAMKRDWEQTKSDIHAGGRDLNQGVSDTVKQATGKEAIPPMNAPSLSWDDAEQPLAFGYGARTQYGKDHTEWNDRLEGTLRSEWEQGRDKSRRAWEDVKSFVRRGYEHAKR